MSRWEVLSRATACAVRAPGRRGGAGGGGGGGGGGRLSFLASQHVTHPFRYPGYYDRPEHAFVHGLADADVRCTLELRSADGSGAPVVVGAAARGVLGSPRRDVALVRLADEAAFLAAAAAAGLALEELPLADGPPAEGVPLSVHGHVLSPVAALPPAPPRAAAGAGAGAAARAALGEDAAAEDEDGSRLVPRAVGGVFLSRSGLQAFARTAEVLEMGMCGGPVLDARTGACVGVVEGIVPPAPPAGAAAGGGGVAGRARELLAGAAVFVELDDIRHLLDLDGRLGGRAAML